MHHHVVMGMPPLQNMGLADPPDLKSKPNMSPPPLRSNADASGELGGEGVVVTSLQCLLAHP